MMVDQVCASSDWESRSDRGCNGDSGSVHPSEAERLSDTRLITTPWPVDEASAAMRRGKHGAERQTRSKGASPHAKSSSFLTDGQSVKVEAPAMRT